MHHIHRAHRKHSHSVQNIGPQETRPHGTLRKSPRKNKVRTLQDILLCYDVSVNQRAGLGLTRDHHSFLFLLGAHLKARGAPHFHPRRYYLEKRQERVEEGPKVSRMRTKKYFTFRYASPCHTTKKEAPPVAFRSLLFEKMPKGWKNFLTFLCCYAILRMQQQRREGRVAWVSRKAQS